MSNSGEYMFEDSIFMAFREIKKVLKEDKNWSDKKIVGFIIFMSILVIVPIVIFEYWPGRLIGLALVIIIFLRLLKQSKPNTLK